MTAPSLLEATISKLLQHLEKEPVDVYMVPSIDEHLNEFVPAYKQRLQAITGFSGSAGVALFCRQGKHQLFVDSRYHLQAEQQIPNALFDVQKLGKPQVPTVAKWLTQTEHQHGSLKVGFDPFTLTPKTYRLYRKSLQKADSKMVPLLSNWVDQVWPNRPPAPQNPFYCIDESWSGEPVASKLKRVREKMQGAGTQALVLSKLDEIAWLTNLRGSDIACNPVFEGYCIVEMEQATCFSLAQAPKNVQESLKESFQFKPYADYPKHLQSLSNVKIWLDPTSTTMGTYLTLQQKDLAKEITESLHEKENPIVLFKALKNPTEIQQIRTAHRHAACGKIRSFVKLHQHLAQGIPLSEKGYAELLQAEYAKEEGFVDLSFPTISGFAENGAIVHYSNPSATKMLQPGHLLLVDSGIQIAGGTTDDTRTVALGEPTPRQKQIYTQVLQGHIRLALQKFPTGTKGSALDAVARAPLWNAGLDYGHGTGHGVGAFLNVHEGPQNISPLSHSVDLRAGMVVSNEPGYYEADWGGIRLENLYVVVPLEAMPPHPAGSTWLSFDPLTLIPFDRQLIDPSSLQTDELQWLQTYHQRVWDEISPHLAGDDLAWLQKACQPLMA